MRFVTIAAKNLVRRPARSLVTILGLAIAVATVVSLVGAAELLESSYLALYSSRGSDLVVQRRGGMGQISKGIPQSFGDRIRALSQAGPVISGLLDLVSFEDHELYIVVVEGIEHNSFVFDRIKITAGRRLQAGDEKCVMLGRILAASLGKRPGDTVEIYAHPFKVVGVFEALNVFENGFVLMPLDVLQQQMDRPGQVTGFLVQAKPPGDADAIAALRQQIESLDPMVAATPCAEFVRSVSQMRETRMMSWTIAGIAGLIGSLGMLNTMAMSVFERKREIGALRAMGWRKTRVVRLILEESLMLAAAGMAIGIPFGVGAVSILSHWHVTSNLFQGNVSMRTIGEAALMAVAMATIGALYPALRIAHVPPIESIRGT